ncbi:hypothetical protein KAZ92_03560 [Candidatus Gracilibacteria bacterium]|nr:hypothetical protein [Candidatus Gracilibacteria bacterium]
MTSNAPTIDRHEASQQEMDTCLRFAMALIEENGNATAAAKWLAKRSAAPVEVIPHYTLRVITHKRRYAKIIDKS